MMIILMMLIMMMMMKMMKEEAEIKLAEYEIESDHPEENFDSVKPGSEVNIKTLNASLLIAVFLCLFVIFTVWVSKINI